MQWRTQGRRYERCHPSSQIPGHIFFFVKYSLRTIQKYKTSSVKLVTYYHFVGILLMLPIGDGDKVNVRTHGIVSREPNVGIVRNRQISADDYHGK